MAAVELRLPRLFRHIGHLIAAASPEAPGLAERTDLPTVAGIAVQSRASVALPPRHAEGCWCALLRTKFCGLPTLLARALVV